MFVGRKQAMIAVVMAYAIMLILVSPVVPSPLTTIRNKQAVHPPHLAAPVSALLFAAVFDFTRASWLLEKPERLLTSGSDVVDLTTARLC